MPTRNTFTLKGLVNRLGYPQAKRTEATQPPLANTLAGHVMTWQSPGGPVPVRYLGAVGNGVLVEVRVPGQQPARRIIPGYQLEERGKRAGPRSFLVTKGGGLEDKVLAAVREAGYSLLSRLGPKVGATPQSLHAAVVNLARQGKVGVSALEGRYATAEDLRWAFRDPAFGEGKIGAVIPR
jgi:hypothetical protein